MDVSEVATKWGADNSTVRVKSGSRMQNAGNVTVNGQTVMVQIPDMDGSGTDADNDDITVDTDDSTDFPETAKVEIIFAVEAGIVNPGVAGEYKVEVTTTVDSTGMTTALGQMIQGYVSGVKVAHSPEGTGENAKVTVEFTTDSGLEANVGTITIDLDKDLGVPASISESEVTIRGTSDVLIGDALVKWLVRTGAPLDVTVSYEGIDKNHGSC